MSAKSRKTREVVADLQPEQTQAIPWSEWADAELNAEKWDVPKNGNDGHFLDPEPRVIPPSIEPRDWKRGSALRSLSSNPVVFAPSNEYPDFVKNNEHILHSEFVRWFISTMINLQYAGRDGLQVEGESPNFIWLGESRPWQGWMYVYSMNKAGNLAPQHRPLVNPNGKYVVRLFFMGCWRRFVVDDMIPVDGDGKPLLPRTERDFELWPMLLAKAMMKLGALSWTSQREINDFYPVSCFTGWICLPLVAKSLSLNEKWDLLTRYADEGSEVEIPRNEQDAATSAEEGNADDKKQNPDSLLRRNSHPRVLIFANFAKVTETISEITPCLSHPVYIANLEDTAVDASQVRWKLYRYFDWTSRHGMIGPRNSPGPSARSLKLISPLRRCVAESPEEDIGEEMEPSLSSEGMPKVSGHIATGIVRQKPDNAILLPDIGVWADFSKNAPYLDEILVYYKTWDFEYYTRVSDALRISTADNQLHSSAAGSRVKSQATGGKDGKKAQTASASSVSAPLSFQSSLKWQQKVSGFKNDPLYMLTDSMDAKFVLIEFCAMPRSNPASGRSYLIVERHNFFEKSTDDDPAALIKTFSTGATIFEAEPGRHLYRILFRPGYSYFVRISSDTIFHLGDRFRMHDLMSIESDRIDEIAKDIGNRISAAFQEFGKPGYANQLRAFYHSYMPRGRDKQKILMKSIHQLFIEELEKLVKETFSSVDTAAICHALRVFFLNPAIGIGTRDGETNYQTKKDEYEESAIFETAAVGIQSFFRMALVKVYKKMHDPSHVKHSEIMRSLRKVVDLFDYSKRESAAHFLIRQIIQSTCTRGQTPPLYPCHGDLSQVLNVEEWRGVVRNVQPGQWVPILRVVLNAPTPNDDVYAGIDFISGLPRCVVRMVDNETYREVGRFLNKVTISRYRYVKRGYTLIGYGWSDANKFKELDWCVRVTTVKGQSTFRQIGNSKLSCPLGTKPPSLTVQELSYNYIPNVFDIIGKWIVTISIDSLLSLRLSTSYNMVETVIKISDKDGNVLCEANGGSTLILPVAYLSSNSKRASREGAGDAVNTRSRSKSIILDSTKDEGDPTTEYYVRAYVANDSWPLTPTEWVVANDAKAKGTVYDPRYGRNSISSVSKRSIKARVSGRGFEDKLHGDSDVTSDSTSQTILQHPLCRLQVLVDVGTKVQIEQDRRREIAIAGMKKSWEDGEPGRLLRGRELREEFLESNLVSTTLSKASAELSEPEMSSVQRLSTAEIRALKPPSNISRVLPPWKTTAYVSNDEDDEEERWVKTEGDEEMLRNQRAINLLDFYQAQAARIDEDVGLIHDQRQRYSDLSNSYKKKVNDWKSLADAAQEKRDFYVAEVKTTLAAGVASKSGKDRKKMKKKK